MGLQQDGGADGDDEDMCVVCWERPKEVIFLSCGHMVSLRRSCASACCALEAVAPFPHQPSAAYALPLI